jgi:putative aminopeptidase FrvX
MTESQKQFMIRLLNEPAPSGYEGPVQAIWKNEVSKFCKDIKKDVHGNLTATQNPGKPKSALIVGHSDEVGLIANFINNEGFIYVNSIGGVDPSILGSQRVRIITKKGIVHGVIGRTSVHLEITPITERKLPRMHEIWVDIGAKNKKDAEKYVSMGDPIIFGNDFQQMTGDTATARCWDNRVGVFVVAEVLRNLQKVKKLNHTVYGVSSVQEETSLWGARGPAYALKPTLGIAIDVMPCTDSPGILKERFGDTKVGNGPVITRGVRTNNVISDELISIAKRKKIPYQVDVDSGYTSTDADPISQVRAGIPTSVISLATRYLHSSVETLRLKDIENTILLLTQYIVLGKLEV